MKRASQKTRQPQWLQIPVKKKTKGYYHFTAKLFSSIMESLLIEVKAYVITQLIYLPSKSSILHWSLVAWTPHALFCQGFILVWAALNLSPICFSVFKTSNRELIAFTVTAKDHTSPTKRHWRCIPLVQNTSVTASWSHTNWWCYFQWDMGRLLLEYVICFNTGLHKQPLHVNYL